MKLKMKNPNENPNENPNPIITKKLSKKK